MTDFVSERRVLARAVKAEVDAIFGAAPHAPARGPSKVRALTGAKARRATPAASIGAGVALALGGIAIGALLTRTPPPRPQPVAATTPAPQPTGSLQVELTPQPTIKPLVIEPTPPPTASPSAAAVRARPKAVQGDCARPGGPRCGYSTVLAADRALRNAYRRAASAGVSRGELATYRRSWSRLRPAGSRDPDRVVRGYRAMAADLNRLARERRS